MNDKKNEMQLKRVEPPEPTWEKDKLNRKGLADSITNLIRNQEKSLIIALNGYWGTGKTFFLKCWERQLKDKSKESGFHVIYFNAWEDDFHDDPLVAIIGQLSLSLKAEDKFKQLIRQIKNMVTKIMPLAVQIVCINHGCLMPRIDLEEILEKFAGRTFENYESQSESKRELKSKLEELAKKIKNENRRLVFIIDELDRCRPTFAIELLERVKHIFDIPGMVFVFGINRDELCSAIKSIYGEIEADVYLRRFFDMEFLLPEADPPSFSKFLVEEYNLEALFHHVSRPVNDSSDANEFNQLHDLFTLLAKPMGLSLRDIEYCIRSMAYVGKRIVDNGYMHPNLLVILIILRLKNNSLYRQFINGESQGSQIIDYIDERVYDGELGNRFGGVLNEIEVDLYLTHHDNKGECQPREQLELLEKGQELTHPEYLSRRTRESSDEKRIKFLRESVAQKTKLMDFDRSEDSISSQTRQYLFSLLELIEMPRKN